MIKLIFEKTYRLDRRGELCSAAVPFPKGKLYSTKDIAVINEGAVYPSQPKITSYWDDGSIRWIHVYFLADLPADSACVYYLSYDGAINNDYIGAKTLSGNNLNEYSDEIPYTQAFQQNKNGSHSQTEPKTISCRKDGTGYTIDTGVLKITFESGRFGGIKEALAYGMKYYLGNFDAPELKDASGRTSKLEFFDFEVLEEGNVCVILQADAVHRMGKYDYHVRYKVTAWAGSPIVDISYILFNENPEELEVKSLTIHYRSIDKADRTCAAVSNYETDFEIGENGEPVEKFIDTDYILKENNSHISEVLYGTLFVDCLGEHGGVAATIYQAKQNYPKAVYADENGFSISLVPESSGGIIMHSMTSREHRYMLHFHDAYTSLEEINNVSLIYQTPLRPVLEPDILEI